MNDLTPLDKLDIAGTCSSVIKKRKDAESPSNHSINASPRIELLPPSLRDIDASSQEQVRRLARFKRFEKGEVLVRANETLEDVIFVQSGWISLSTNGRVTEFLGPGAPYLAADILGSHRPASTAIALTEVHAALLDRRVTAQVLMANPRVLLAALDHAVLATSRLRIAFAQKSLSKLENRLGHLLWTLSDESPQGERFVAADLSQAVLASFLGHTREQINRKKSELIKTGRLKKIEKRLYIQEALVQDLIADGYSLSFWSRQKTRT